jgi:hypothetical protein
MKHAVFTALFLGILSVSPKAIAAERFELRAPGGIGAATSNEIGVWKSAKAAGAANESLVQGKQYMSPDLACIVRPGTKAEVKKREGSVVFVRASNALFGGCKGFVKTEFLSAN